MLRSWWSEYCEQFSLDRIGIDLSWEEASIRYAQLMLSPGNFIFKSVSNNEAESEPYEKILVERGSMHSGKHVPIEMLKSLLISSMPCIITPKVFVYAETK